LCGRDCGVNGVGDQVPGNCVGAREKDEDIEAEDVEAFMEEFGARVPVRVQDPVKPSQAEVEEHTLTHVPFRSWCEHCVRGRGEDSPHFRSKDEPRELELHMDFCFVGDEGREHKITILVARERCTRMTVASAAPSKGAAEFLARRLLAFLREIGADKGDLVVRCDQEPAIVAVFGELARHRAAAGGGRTIPEHSPVADSQGNGVAERAVKSVEGQLRVLRSALETRIRAKVPSEHAVMSWMTEYAAVVLNRYEVGKDGKTAYERNRNKRSKAMGLEFGEAVLWRRRPVGNNLAKLSLMWEHGVYLGLKGTTGEVIVGDEKGVWRTRTVRRRPVEDRWSAEAVEKIRGVPWEKAEEKKEAEVIDPGGALERVPEPMLEQEKRDVREELRAPKSFGSKREDYERHGYTRGCQGCRALLTGTTRQQHSVQCRSRMMEALKDDARVKAAKRRREEFLEKVTVRATPGAGGEVQVTGKDDGKQGMDAAKRSRMQEIEEQAMQTDDIEKLGPLYTEYMELEAASEALKGVDEDGGGAVRATPSAGAAQATEAPLTGGGTASGLSSEDRKRPVEDDGFAELAERIKRRSAMATSRDDKKGAEMDIGKLEVDISELEVNVEDDPWEEWTASGEYSDCGDYELDPEALRQARKEEVAYMQKIRVWEPSTAEECIRRTGKRPITTRWVDVDKGRDGEVCVRSRLVARDFKLKNDELSLDVFAATPPLDAVRLVLRMAMVDGIFENIERRGKVKLMFIDVKKAHLNGVVDDDQYVYVQLPEEAGGGVARLRRWLYGTRPAGAAWEEDYSGRLVAAGFRRGRAASTVFFNPVSGLRVVVWGDDFTVVGCDQDLKEFAEMMRSWYDIKVKAVLGPEVNDDKEVRILNRVVRWKPEMIEYEGDEKHVATVLNELGFDEHTKGLDAPLAKDHEPPEGDEELDETMARSYRRLAATVNYISLDRPDLQFAASVLGRTMSRPTAASWANLKKVARYLKKHPRMVFMFKRAGADSVRELVGFSDSDWAGCRATRRSMSGGLVTLAGSVLRSWSNRQATVALSVGEAELHSATKAAAELIGIQSVMLDLGWAARLKLIRLNVDSSTAQSIVHRRGVGRIRHLEVRHLWLQDLVKAGAILVRKVPGAQNPADPMTKTMGWDEMIHKLSIVNLRGG